MIPSDVASRLQITSDAALRPVAPTQEISDKLGDLVAGQRLMAEIQALLPNGTYRALINQRNVTLALPFSAKAGDSLELQVTESDGKLTLAVVSPQGGSEKAATESVSTSLSRTGQLIGDLYSGNPAPKDKVATLLNANQPIAASPPETAGELVPLLKQAIQQSGMFYESHQAGWVEGKISKFELLQEPQGKLSSPAAFTPAPEAENQKTAASTTAARVVTASPAESPQQARTEATPSSARTDAGPAPTAQTIATPLQPLVQQQLEALATQHFVWQGQVWPGQDMRWEIDENGARQSADDESTAQNWATRLRLTLPNLGEIDARIQLKGNQISLALSAGDESTRDLMRTQGPALRQQLDAAGLALMTMGVETPEPADNHGEA